MLSLDIIVLRYDLFESQGEGLLVLLLTLSGGHDIRMIKVFFIFPLMVDVTLSRKIKVLQVFFFFSAPLFQAIVRLFFLKNSYGS